MGRSIGVALIGAALGFAIALAINEVIFAGPEYGNAFAWAVVGGMVGLIRAWQSR